MAESFTRTNELQVSLDFRTCYLSPLNSQSNFTELAERWRAQEKLQSHYYENQRAFIDARFYHARDLLAVLARTLSRCALGTSKPQVLHEKKYRPTRANVGLKAPLNGNISGLDESRFLKINSTSSREPVNRIFRNGSQE